MLRTDRPVRWASCSIVSWFSEVVSSATFSRRLALRHGASVAPINVTYRDVSLFGVTIA